MSSRCAGLLNGGREDYRLLLGELPLHGAAQLRGREEAASGGAPAARGCSIEGEKRLLFGELLLRGAARLKEGGGCFCSLCEFVYRKRLGIEPVTIPILFAHASPAHTVRYAFLYVNVRTPAARFAKNRASIRSHHRQAPPHQPSSSPSSPLLPSYSTVPYE